MSKFSGGNGSFVPAGARWDGVTRTHEGGQGFARTSRQELFLQAVSEMAEGTFYESAEVRRGRLAACVSQVVSEPGGWEWVCRFVPWLRESGMRSVSIMVAAEAVASAPPGSGGRALVSAACARGDEPAEFLGYWLQFHGRKIPAAVKRGIADAAVRLYGERNVLRYDGGSRSVRMADVVEMVHPSPASGVQSALFRQLLDERHGRGQEVGSDLPALRARARLEKFAPEARHEFMRAVSAGSEAESGEFELALAGQWEWAKSWLGQR